MIFIETSIFTKLAYKYLYDDEFAGLQWFLLKYPERLYPAQEVLENFVGR